MHLLDDILGERHFLPGLINLIEQQRITRYILLVSCVKRLCAQTCHNPRDVGVGELHAFNTRRRTDTFDGGDSLEFG